MDRKCAFNQELLAAYLDNELSGNELRQVTEHLKECDECSAMLESLKESDKAFADYAGCGKTELYWRDYTNTLNQKLPMQNKEAIPVRRFIFWQIAAPVAAVVLVALIVYYLIPKEPLDRVLPDVTGVRVEPARSNGGIGKTAFVAPDSAVNAESSATDKVLAGSEAALVNLVNMDENDLVEMEVFQAALADSGLIENIRDNKNVSKDKEVQGHLNRLEAVFTWAQNGSSAEEIGALKDVIVSNSLIEQNRLTRDYVMSRNSRTR